MRTHFRHALALCALAISCTSGSGRPRPTPQLGEVATALIKDVQATVTVEKADSEELRKINREFGLTYKLKEVTLSYKEQDKLRMEGRIGVYIVNGATRLFRFPQLGIKKKDELGDSTANRPTLLDIGVVPSSLLPITRARYLRDEAIDDRTASVFELSFTDDTQKYMVWIDPKTHVLIKKTWFDSLGKLKATFFYKDVRELSPGIWAPTRLEVRNSEGTVAGVTTCRDLKVNQGLADSLFEIS